MGHRTISFSSLQIPISSDPEILKSSNSGGNPRFIF